MPRTAVSDDFDSCIAMFGWLLAHLLFCFIYLYCSLNKTVVEAGRVSSCCG